MKLNYLLLLLLITALGCECPPGAETPKVITPSEYANINIFNALYSNDYIEIETKYGLFYKQLGFGSSFSEYLKIGSNSNFLKLKNQDNDYFYNVPLFFKKDSNYTAVLTGNNLDIIPILIEEKFSQLKTDNSYLRIINASRILDSIDYKIDNSDESNSLLKGQFTNFIQLINQQPNIKIYNNSEMILNFNHQAKANTAYTMILYYDPASQLDYQLNFRFLEHKIE